MEFKIQDHGLRDYGEMLHYQRDLFAAMTERKKKGLALENEYLILVEHNPVVTLGKHAHRANLLYSAERMADLGVQVWNIERGGDVTYHGPGQLVVYPIIDLEAHRLGIKDYVFLLEEAVIRTIAEFGIYGERVQGASGVWIGAGTPDERKICALGVKCSRFITMHGLALNVNTDLNGFSLINPCGFIDKGVTSMSKETGNVIDMALVKDIITRHFVDLLNISK